MGRDDILALTASEGVPKVIFEKKVSIKFEYRDTNRDSKTHYLLMDFRFENGRP